MALGVFYLTIFFGNYTLMSFNSGRKSNQIALLDICIEMSKDNLTLPFDEADKCSFYLKSPKNSDPFQLLLESHFPPSTRFPGMKNPFCWIALIIPVPAILGLILSTPLKELKSRRALWSAYLITSLTLTLCSFYMFLKYNYWEPLFGTAYMCQVLVTMATFYMGYRREGVQDSPSLIQVLFRAFIPSNGEDAGDSGTNPSSTPKGSPEIVTAPQDEPIVTSTAKGYDTVDRMERGELRAKAATL